MKRTSFGVLVLGGLIGLHRRPFNFSFFSITGWGIDLDSCDIEWFYEDLQILLELTPQKDVPFIIRDRNAEVGSQEIPGVTGLEYRMKQGKSK